MKEELSFKNPETKVEKNETPEWIEKVRKYYKGEMHAHSLRSNREDIGGADEGRLHRDKRLMKYADKLGLDFTVFSEHASNPGNPKQLSETHPICKSLLAQQDDIDRINSSEKYSATAISAVESSVFFDENGQAILDVPDSVLSKMDLVIASRHEITQQWEVEKIKQSLLAGINNPEVDIIGHPYRHIEFYNNDWQYFKNNSKKDSELFDELDLMEKNKEWDKIKQIIGKTEVLNGERIEELHELFVVLKNEYWDMWDEVLDAMEKQGKVFEINLNAFIPGKEFYQTLLIKAAKRKNLKFSISYDFHNLTQQKNFKDDNIEERPADIKSPGRAKAVQRLIGLTNLLEDLKIKPDRVINSSLAELEKFIEKRKGERNF